MKNLICLATVLVGSYANAQSLPPKIANMYLHLAVVTKNIAHPGQADTVFLCKTVRMSDVAANPKSKIDFKTELAPNLVLDWGNFMIFEDGSMGQWTLSYALRLNIKSPVPVNSAPAYTMGQIAIGTTTVENSTTVEGVPYRVDLRIDDRNYNMSCE